MSSILIKNAKAIVTLDMKDRVLKNESILIIDNEIKSIGIIAEDIYVDEVIDGSSMFVYPGLINTHHHLYQTFTRNLPKVQNMELFPWLTALYEIWKGLTPEIIYYSSLTGMGELLKYGCTTCFDHHYVFQREGTSDFLENQFAAAKALGIRFHAARGSMSRGKTAGGLPPDELVQDLDTILRDSEAAVKKYHDASKFSMGQVALAPCSPFSVTSELMEESGRLGRRLGVRLHTHLAETKDEEDYCMQKFGLRPLEYMESLGWLGKDVWFAHGIHFNDEEIRKLGRTGTGVAHCPGSNMKLSSGVARLPLMLKEGVPLGLAVDGSSSNDCSNMLAEIRYAFLLQRLSYSSKALTGYEILKLATTGGAKLLGREDIGSLEIGKAADLFMIDTNRIELIGATLDPMGMLATVGYNRPVDYTIVNGKVLVRQGELCRVDEKEIVQKSNVLLKKYLDM